MSVEIEPLTPELETAIRRRLEHNPFVKFMGIQVPELGQGYARFVLQVRPEFHNSQGFLQGGVIAALADEAVAYALFSTVSENEMINTVEMKINFLRPVR
ncbi:MAG: PaaI family thioesterase, partial [Deltaproteobacteria bacterium]|nr:PaaI family thioesterase [Deltaproteobacteria bacterium]